MKKLNNKIKRKVRNRKKLKDVGLNKLRISVTKSLNNLSAQIIDDLNKKTVVSASSIEKDIKSKKIKKIEKSFIAEIWQKSKRKNIKKLRIEVNTNIVAIEFCNSLRKWFNSNMTEIKRQKVI